MRLLTVLVMLTSNNLGFTDIFFRFFPYFGDFWETLCVEILFQIVFF